MIWLLTITIYIFKTSRYLYLPLCTLKGHASRSPYIAPVYPDPLSVFYGLRRGGEDGGGCKEHGAPFNLIGGRVVGGGASALKNGGP